MSDPRPRITTTGPTTAVNTVTLEFWVCPKYGDRWSLVADNGKTAATRGTEAEARRFAEWHGWLVTSAGGEGQG